MERPQEYFTTDSYRLTLGELKQLLNESDCPDDAIVVVKVNDLNSDSERRRVGKASVIKAVPVIDKDSDDSSWYLGTELWLDTGGPLY